MTSGWIVRIWAMSLATIACVLPVSVNAQAVAVRAHDQHGSITRYIDEASIRFGIPAEWIREVIRVESAGRMHAVSRAGAMGLMQLMPRTWERQRVRLALGKNPFEPRDNIIAGTAYLREMHDRYGSPGFLAAYNAGPGRYEAWLAGRRALPRETRAYVARIARHLRAESSLAASSMQLAGTLEAAEATTPATLLVPREPQQDFANADRLFVSGETGHGLFVPRSERAAQRGGNASRQPEGQ